MTYAQWQQMQAQKQETIPFSLEEYIIFLAEQGKAAEGYLGRISTYLAKHQDTLVLYGDEDVMETDSSCHSPYFKPSWSPDLLENCFYFGSLVVVKRELVERVNMTYMSEDESVGASGKAFTPSKEQVQIVLGEQEASFQNWVRTCMKAAGGYEKRSGACLIGHVPGVLFHCESLEQLERYSKPCNGEADTEGSMEVDGNIPGEEVGGQEEPHKPLVSVIIPSKDHPQLLETCLAAIHRTTHSLAYEIVVVDNGSNEENRQKCHEIFGGWQEKEMQITYLYEPMEFHFSRMCNLGAEQAKGELLLFLNDDVELACEGTLSVMAERALRPYVGAVGLKLYYPEGKRIQHAGITNLPMGPVHKLQFLEDGENYYFHSNRGIRNVLAVTAACLLVGKEKFREAGGFPENLRVAFNDVSLCFRLYELGYYNSCVNELYAYHHESLSRGNDEDTAKLQRLLGERQQLYQNHPGLQGQDPYYSRNLSRGGLDTRIRPAYETAGNKPQQSTWVQKADAWPGYRQDNCLLLRVEMSTPEEVLGYGIVLGDDNACYDRELLLCPMDKIQEQEPSQVAQQVLMGALPVLTIPLEGQYRPDLVENLPDQKNVGLCGFWLMREQGVDSQEVPTEAVKPKGDPGQGEQPLPAGNYLIGMAVRNRVTGTRLLQFSNREWKIEP